MKRILPAIISCFALTTACSSPAPQPDSAQTEQPAQTAPAPQTSTADEQPDEAASSITYLYRNGAMRAYLPLSSSICQEDETAQALYEIEALWRYDAAADAWTPVEVAPDVRYRLACNAMVQLGNMLGYDLDPATYAIAAEVDGKLELAVFQAADTDCNTDALGTPPEGHIAACIVDGSTVRARFVSDPADLEL